LKPVATISHFWPSLRLDELAVHLDRGAGVGVRDVASAHGWRLGRGARQARRVEGLGQKWEIGRHRLQGAREADATTRSRREGHTLEFLREIAHLRRARTFRRRLPRAQPARLRRHQFFQERGFFYVHNPIITASDARARATMFRVTTLDLAHPPMTPEGHVEWRGFLRRDLPHRLRPAGGQIFAHALKHI